MSQLAQLAEGFVLLMIAIGCTVWALAPEPFPASNAFERTLEYQGVAQ